MRQKTITKMYIRRRRLGMTQSDLGSTIGVTQPRISLWETRLADLPPARRSQIAEALGVDAETLLDDA